MATALLYGGLTPTFAGGGLPTLAPAAGAAVTWVSDGLFVPLTASFATGFTTPDLIDGAYVLPARGGAEIVFQGGFVFEHEFGLLLSTTVGAVPNGGSCVGNLIGAGHEPLAPINRGFLSKTKDGGTIRFTSLPVGPGAASMLLINVTVGGLLGTFPIDVIRDTYPTNYHSLRQQAGAGSPRAVGPASLREEPF